MRWKPDLNGTNNLDIRNIIGTNLYPAYSMLIDLEFTS